MFTFCKMSVFIISSLLSIILSMTRWSVGRWSAGKRLVDLIKPVLKSVGDLKKRINFQLFREYHAEIIRKN